MVDSIKKDNRDFETALGNIALGYKEKIEAYNNGTYMLSRKLKKGIEMFLLLKTTYSGESALEYADAASFTENYALKMQVCNWLSGRERESLGINWENFPLKGEDPILYQDFNNNLKLTKLGEQLLEFADPDNLEETRWFKLMTLCRQEEYVLIREFIIQHPVIKNQSEYTKILLALKDNETAQDALMFAYDEIQNKSFFPCPLCGFPMSTDHQGIKHCLFSKCERKLDRSGLLAVKKCEGYFQLKPSIMRYITLPGKLEMLIKDACKREELEYHMWPYFDTFDVEIVFSDGSFWEIDAKDWVNPYALRNHLEKKTPQEGSILEKGYYEKGYIVIPDEYGKQKGYKDIVKQALNSNWQCITLSELIKKIKAKKRKCEKQVKLQ